MPRAKRVVHHGADGLGVEVLGERGRADHVQEQDADLLEGLRGLGRRRGRAVSAASLARAAASSDSTTASPSVDALGFQGGDRGFELLLLGHRR